MVIYVDLCHLSRIMTKTYTLTAAYTAKGCANSNSVIITVVNLLSMAIPELIKQNIMNTLYVIIKFFINL